MPSKTTLLAAAALFALAACASGDRRISLGLKGETLRVEVARSEAERERGLMHRASLGKREGMLFVFDADQHLGFWMKDTPLPLSIAFLSATGKIMEIQDMEPFSLKTIRSRYSCRYALEMALGTFQQIGASVGDVVSFPAGFR